MGFDEFWRVGYGTDGFFALVLREGCDVGEDRLEVYHGHGGRCRGSGIGNGRRVGRAVAGRGVREFWF